MDTIYSCPTSNVFSPVAQRFASPNMFASYSPKLPIQTQMYDLYYHRKALFIKRLYLQTGIKLLVNFDQLQYVHLQK